MCRGLPKIVATYDFPSLRDISIDVHEKVYPPGEDTFLVIDNIGPNIAGRFLEIGVGTGIISIYAAKMGARVTGTDINPSAVSNARVNAAKNKVCADFHTSDLFSGISGRFRTIVFNPPYLSPGENGTDDSFLAPWEKQALLGGRSGIETSVRFLEQCPDHLEKNGVIYLVASSVGDVKQLLDRFQDRFVFLDIARRDYHGERLTLFLIKEKEAGNHEIQFPGRP